HPCVVVEVEEHVVEARADQATEERELGRLQQRLGIEAATNRIAMREHEAERHRGRHQDAVPAQRERADVEGDGAGRTEHQERWTRDGTNGVGVAAVEFTVSLYGALVSLSNKTRTLGPNLLTSSGPSGIIIEATHFSTTRRRQRSLACQETQT